MRNSVRAQRDNQRDQIKLEAEAKKTALKIRNCERQIVKYQVALNEPGISNKKQEIILKNIDKYIEKIVSYEMKFAEKAIDFEARKETRWSSVGYKSLDDALGQVERNVR